MGEVDSMQRCPYIHEMKERLLGDQIPMEIIPAKKIPTPPPPPFVVDQPLPSKTVATVVKLNSDGYGSHTSPTRTLKHECTPLMPKKVEKEFQLVHRRVQPKNAKTSLFIIMSFLYAKLLVVVCIGYVFSDVVTHNLPLYYYEGFFTYLYGVSILFLLTSLFIIMSFLYAKLLVVVCIGYVFSDVVTHNLPLYYYEGFFTCLYGVSILFLLTSLFIIMSFLYAKLLVVVCIGYVFSDVVTHNLPLYYYEGFFTYLYGVSILFLLYVFCFLLQESSCCSDGGESREAGKKQAAIAAKEKEKEKEKERKKEADKKKKEEKEKKEKEKKEKGKEKDKKKKGQEKQEDVTEPVPLQWQFEASTYRRNSEGVVDAALVPEPVAALSQSQGAPLVSQEPTPAAGAGAAPPPAHAAPPPVAGAGADVEVGVSAAGRGAKCRRKTSQNEHSHGSFFLRIGAIAFGLGTMIYSGLEFGLFFEVPFTSPCYMILRGINPSLQMVFTFMQMYFIFMNSRLNIHRFKVVARFGLMHVVATNICVWIRTLVIEYLKDITKYHVKANHTTVNLTTESAFAESIRHHNLRNANTVLGTHKVVPDIIRSTATSLLTSTPSSTTTFRDMFRMKADSFMSTVSSVATTLRPSTTTPYSSTTSTTTPSSIWRFIPTISSTTSTTTPSPINLRMTTARIWKMVTTTLSSTTTTTTTTPVPRTFSSFKDFGGFDSFASNNLANVNEVDFSEEVGNDINLNDTQFFDDIIPQALRVFNGTSNVSTDSCGRVNIMGSIVEESSPYLYPFIVEYSLIGAAVIYVMWKHIGRKPKYVTQEDLEHRLEVMLSRRAVALAHAQHGRVDCIGASKGLFLGLLMLVASLICLILFFVLISNNAFRMLAIYLAEVSHCILMVLSIIAIIVGFIRVQQLKFKTEERSDLNDILLRISAFGLFLYAVFSVVAGHLDAFTVEANLLTMITGILAILQVILQLLFIADISRRRVHLPEHDRSKPGRQVVTFLLICNLTIWIIYTFEMRKVEENPVQLRFYGFLTWSLIQRITLPLCIFHRFHSAVALAEIWKTTYKARLE